MVMVGVILVAFTIFRYTLYSLYMNITDIAYLQHLHFFYIYSVNIKFGTKFIIALCDLFKKITRTGRFNFEKCHPVTCSLFQ
jgi:hypothetical protein